MFRFATLGVTAAADRVSSVPHVEGGRELDPTWAVGALWSYAEVDVTILGALVGLVVMAAVLLIGRRAIGPRRAVRRR